MRKNKREETKEGKWDGRISPETREEWGNIREDVYDICKAVLDVDRFSFYNNSTYQHYQTMGKALFVHVVMTKVLSPEPRLKKRWLAEFLNCDRTTMYHLEAKHNEFIKNDLIYRKMLKESDYLSSRLIVEGNIKDGRKRLSFINKQMEKLRKRQEHLITLVGIQESSHEDT